MSRLQAFSILVFTIDSMASTGCWTGAAISKTGSSRPTTSKALQTKRHLHRFIRGIPELQLPKDKNFSSDMYPSAPLRAPQTRTGLSFAATPDLFVSLTQCNPPSTQYLFRKPNITHGSHGTFYWPICSPNHPTKGVAAWKIRFFEGSTCC